VENRPGPGGNIGSETVAKAAADGYTILMEVMTSNAINASLYKNLNFDFRRDIAPVALIRTGEDRAGVPRLRQGQSGQDQHGLGRQAHRRMRSASCSRCWRMSTWCTCHTKALTCPIC
jgi:Tripartite tricarboxylate transporter family receptor